jgi:hypothetical protein
MRNRLRDRDGEAEPLTIDLAAAAELPSSNEIHHWARDQRVFISSVMDELKTERRAVAQAIRSLGAEPVWFEEFGGRDADPNDAYTAEVASSTVYVGILGQRYGRLLPTRFSATHTEYLFAEEHGLRISVYPLDVPDREGRQQAFLDEVWQFHTAPLVAAADLPAAVIRRLERIAAEEMAPWCKLGNVVFRASSVSETKEQIVVNAKARSRDVSHALDQMAGERWSSFDGQFTWHGRSQAVRVTDIEVTTTASTSRAYRISLERREAQRDSLLDVSLGKKTPDDLTEIAIRVALLDEQNPLSEQQMDFMADLGDPLASLRKQKIPDEIFRAIAQLLLAETLVGSGRIARITKFRLGADVAGKRRLELGWETPRRYSNAKPQQRQVSGALRLR